MACRITQKVCKTEGETKRWAFDYAGFDADTSTWAYLSKTWAPGMSTEAGDTVRPSLPTGLQYSSSGGQSGANEPRWPATVGGTVVDGSTTWTAEAVSNDSLRSTIIDSAWDASTPLSVDDEALANTDGVQIASAVISGGASGQTYEVLNTVTLADGSIEESRLLVQVT